MTLDELFGTKGADALVPSFPYLIVEVDETLLRAGGLPLDEASRWRPSSVSGLFYRIDPEDPALRQKRHVHIAAAKHISAKAKQVSWNDDGGRHDRHSFNDAFGARADYRAVARATLRLPPATILEWVEPRAGRILDLLEASSVANVADHPLRLRTSPPTPAGRSDALDDAVDLLLPD